MNDRPVFFFYKRMVHNNGYFVCATCLKVNGDQVHSVATFFCQIRHIINCSVSFLDETHSKKAGYSVWLNRVHQCGDRCFDGFYTLLYCLIAGTPYDSGDVELHNVALVSSLVLDWSNTRLNHIRPDQAGIVFLYVYIFCICCMYVFWRAAFQRTAGTLWVSSWKTRQGLSFIYHDKMSTSSHTHILIYGTSSTCL